MYMVGAAPFMHYVKNNWKISSISLKNLQDQAGEEKKQVTDPKEHVPKEYWNLLDVFNKDKSDEVSPHGEKNDHQIKLLIGKHLGHSALRPMSQMECDYVKRYIEEHINKEFIEASHATCSSPILLAVPRNFIRSTAIFLQGLQ